MKKRLTLIAIVLPLSFLCSHGQNNKWSAGIRTGLRYDNTIPSSSDNQISLDNRLFLRGKIYKRFGIELSTGYYLGRNSYPFGVIDSSGTFYHDGEVQTTMHNLQINLGITYNLIQRKKIQVYAQAGLSSCISWLKNNLINSSYNFPSLYTNKTEITPIYSFFIGAGLNYSLKQNIYLNASSNIESRLRLEDIVIKNHGPLFIPSLYIGIGYRF